MLDNDNIENKVKEINAGLTSFNNFMIEQAVINDYEELIKIVIDQLDGFLNPVATIFSEYDRHKKTLAVKDVKTKQANINLALKIGGRKILSTVTPVDQEMYQSMIVDRVVAVATLYELTGKVISKSLSTSLGKALKIKSCLVLSYLVDNHLFGTTVVILSYQPQKYIMELLKTYAHFTAVSLKRIRFGEALKKSEEELKTVTHNMTDLVAMTDAEGRFTYLSGSHYRLLGFEPADLLGRRIFEIVHEDDLPYIAAKFNNAMSDAKNDKADYRVIKNDGTVIWVETLGSILFDSDGQISGAVFVTRDITERKQAEDRIRYMSYHDQLTGLYNRHYFVQCEKELNEAPVLSVITTDVNGLKLINDTYGHEFGDELLKKYAELLKESFKKSDLIFRFGGDEFIVILKDTDEAASWKLCKSLIKQCEKTYIKDIPLSISLGIFTKSPGGDLKKALTEAENKMYKQKLNESKSSKNKIIKTLLQTLSEHGFETKEHIDRMISIGRLFGDRLKLTPSELSKLDTLIMLHDIGKINIDSSILMKDTELTAEEWKEIMKHPEYGYRIASTAEEFAYVAQDILHHHERWDGQGYPMGVSGDKIPYLSRVMNLVDSYEVMSSGRPYRNKMSINDIVNNIESCSGQQFDPELAKEFIVCLREDLF